MFIPRAGRDSLLFAGAFALALAGCIQTVEKKAQDPAAAVSRDAEWTYEESRAIRTPDFEDFAQLEYAMPLSLEDRGRLQPADLHALDQEGIDRIYARLTAGPIPDGYYAGEVFLKAGTKGYLEADSLLLGYFRKMLVEQGMVAADVSFNQVANALWEGKEFSREKRTLRNGVATLEPLRRMGFVRGDPPVVEVDGQKVWMLFPGKVYCGQSLLDSRRESIVIDYLFSDELPDYREMPDFLAGRRGLQVRDEIRMVRPGFYLGRAYMNRIHLLTFTLYNKKVADRELPDFLKTGAIREDCWTGTQLRRTPAPR